MTGRREVKRFFPLLLCLACTNGERHSEPRPPAGEVWLSQAQIAAQQLRIEVVAEQMLETRLDAPGRTCVGR